MKNLLCALVLLAAAAMIPCSSEAASGFSRTTLGNQYIYIEPSNTTCVAPQFLCPGSGLLTQSGITTNTVYGVTEAVTNGTIAYLSFSNNYAIGGDFAVSAVATNGSNAIFTLVGKPPLNSYGVPLSNNIYQYNGSNQPTTYYALVTAGTQKGNFFTVVSNTTNTLTIDSEGVKLAAKDVQAINLLPYWTLSALFPSSQATISFIPTTNTSNVMTTVVISPPTTTGTNQPQSVGPSFYFNASLTNWVSTTNPTVSAADAVIPPGSYVYVQNLGSNTYPLYEFISGSVMTNQFNIYFTSSASNSVISYFSLPRSTDYQLSKIGFTDLNFTQSPSKSPLARNDVLIIDNGHGGVGAMYYKYKNLWYNTSSDALSTNPVLPAGTVFGVKKPASKNATSLLINQSNLPAPTVVPAASIFKAVYPLPSPGPGAPTNTPNTGGD